MSEIAEMSPVAKTGSGAVAGLRDERGVLAFKGVPYAADTGGENRFRPPQPRAPWTGVYEAAAYGPNCPQMAMGLAIESAAQSEDCLRLNVWTRSLTGARPVMVWLHGGAFRTGNDRAGGVEGANLAANADVVVVSLNHRIGVMGFLQLDEAFGPQYGQSGAAGMLDIAAALQWVRANIAAFGGDPESITIFGVSGGGSKVLHAMAMPAFRGLFRRAIAIDPHELWKRNTQAASTRSSRAILGQLGVAPGETEKLMALPAEAIVDAQVAAMNELESDPDWDHLAWAAYDVMSPEIDGTTLPAWPVEAIAQGAGADADLMLVSNQFTHWLPYAGLADHTRYGWLDEAELLEAVRPYLGDSSEAIVAGYKREFPGAPPSSRLAHIMTDRDWLMPVVRAAEARKQSGARPAYVLYNRAPGTGVFDLLFGAAKPNPLTRGKAMTVAPPYGVGVGEALTGVLTEAVVKFAGTGDPDTPQMPWAPYDAARNVLLFDPAPRLAQDLFAGRREIWGDERAGT